MADNIHFNISKYLSCIKVKKEKGMKKEHIEGKRLIG